jgi:hypothetical protein
MGAGTVKNNLEIVHSPKCRADLHLMSAAQSPRFVQAPSLAILAKYE